MKGFWNHTEKLRALRFSPSFPPATGVSRTPSVGVPRDTPRWSFYIGGIRSSASPIGCTIDRCVFLSVCPLCSGRVFPTDCLVLLL